MSKKLLTFLFFISLSAEIFSDEIILELPSYLVCTERSNLLGWNKDTWKDSNSTIRGDLLLPVYGSKDLEDCVNGLIKTGYEPHGDLVVEVIYRDIEKKKQNTSKEIHKKKFDMFILFYQPMLKKQ